MVEYFADTRKPIPDGFLHILLCYPVDPSNKEPDEEDFNIRVDFAEMSDSKGWKYDEYGIKIWYDSGTITVIPWASIVLYDLMPNSEEYREALNEWTLACEHDWTPGQPYYDPRTGNGELICPKICKKCNVSDKTLEYLEQQQIDKARGLK